MPNIASNNGKWRRDLRYHASSAPAPSFCHVVDDGATETAGHSDGPIQTLVEESGHVPRRWGTIACDLQPRSSTMVHDSVTGVQMILKFGIVSDRIKRPGNAMMRRVDDWSEVLRPPLVVHCKVTPYRTRVGPPVPVRVSSGSSYLWWPNNGSRARTCARTCDPWWR
jgi:hypothetical protein